MEKANDVGVVCGQNVPGDTCVATTTLRESETLAGFRSYIGTCVGSWSRLDGYMTRAFKVDKLRGSEPTEDHCSVSWTSSMVGERGKTSLSISCTYVCLVCGRTYRELNEQAL